MHYQTVCQLCALQQAGFPSPVCIRCDGPLGFEYAAADPRPDPAGKGPLGGYWRMLPLDRAADHVWLGEGNTPLLPSRLFAAITLHWKDESRNPTGSHKDRAMALAMTRARQHGARLSLVVSAGSTGLSNAAYAAAAGLPSVTLMQAGAPRQRIHPLSVYGSRLIEVDAGIDAIIEAARRLSGRDGIAVASTTRLSNPFQAEASKVIAYEIAAQLDGAPDWLVVPVGGGGTVAALWRGFQDLHRAGCIPKPPRIAAVVPKAYDALRAAFDQSITDARAFAALPYSDDVPTILTKLSHAHPPDGLEALAAVRESGGCVAAVEDEAALLGTHRTASTDGLYLEPSSGAVVPVIERLLQAGTIEPGASVVALGCGCGFRETFVMAQARPLRTERIALDGIAALLGAVVEHA